MAELITRLARIGRFTAVPAYQRFAYYCGALLVLSGLFHVGVFLADGGAWEGPLSWRKPIVFGLSFGVTVVTLAWMLGFLHPRRAVAWIVVSVLAVASIGEVALISLLLVDGRAGHRPGRPDGPDHGLVVLPPRRPGQPGARDPGGAGPDDRRSGGRGADDRRGREHVRDRRRPQGPARPDPARHPDPSCCPTRSSGTGSGWWASASAGTPSSSPRRCCRRTADAHRWTRRPG